ncbi:hypothetical protein V8G54_012316 [Vigna mungo]|uniref:Uncharacterized protein n=1 Tax=Vigna mungo TaxID=3915 RepID=A0AAQ3NS20_VIGMU
MSGQQSGQWSRFGNSVSPNQPVTPVFSPRCGSEADERRVTQTTPRRKSTRQTFPSIAAVCNTLGLNTQCCPSPRCSHGPLTCPWVQFGKARSPKPWPPTYHPTRCLWSSRRGE